MHGLPAVALLPQIFASVRISRRGKQNAEIENMSGDSRQWVNAETTHVGPDWWTIMLFFRSVFDAPGAKVTLPPPVRTSFAQTGRRGPTGGRALWHTTLLRRREGNTKGGVSTLKVILHSLYEEHAVSFLLFLWCKTAPGFDLKDSWKGDFHQAAGTQNSMTEPSEEHVGFTTFLSCNPPPTPTIRNRPPACTSRGMIFFLVVMIKSCRKISEIFYLNHSFYS